MSYKSPRLLTEKIHSDIDDIRKALMSMPPEADARDAVAMQSQEQLNDVRKLVDELAAMAGRPSVDDVQLMRPADYVEAMKPLVRKFHQVLMTSNNLAPCLCEDLNATGVLLVLIGEGNTVVRAAHDPAHPEVALAIEAMVDTLDSGTKKVMADGVSAAEEQLGLPPMTPASTHWRRS